MASYKKLKNLAIVAHVDHGKTTMVDGLLRQSGVFGERDEIVERVMDSGDIERERGITIKAKNCAIFWKDTKINLLDTPGHADFGGEVERSLMMANGILLLVDAAEGPLPQTRFVLSKALEKGLKVAVVINKIDRSDARIDEVKSEIEELFLNLSTLLSHEIDLDIPFLYASSREGHASLSSEKKGENLHPILDLMSSDFFPSPKKSESEDLKILVSNLSYSSYLGPLIIGRIETGTIYRLQTYCLIDENNNAHEFKVSAIKTYDKLDMADVDSATQGEIVIIAGYPDAKIGDTISSTDNKVPLKRISVEPPTVSIEVSVNTSPLAGKEGTYLTSRKLEEYLVEATKLNVALSYASTLDPKVFVLKGRGELQLAISLEELRRQGYELMISRPQVLLKKDTDGNILEPYEHLVLDIPESSTGIVTEKLSQRRAILEKMLPLGAGRVRLEFTISSRALIGYRGTFLTDTRGEGLFSTEFIGYRPQGVQILTRQNGAIIADRAGKSTPYGLFGLLALGKQFIRPGETVYEGMVVGEHTKKNDTNVNVSREKHLSSVRTAGKDTNIILPPIQDMILERAMEWIDDDEWIEITPKKIRIRKKTLKQNERSVIR